MVRSLPNSKVVAYLIVRLSVSVREVELDFGLTRSRTPSPKPICLPVTFVVFGVILNFTPQTLRSLGTDGIYGGLPQFVVHFCTFVTLELHFA